MELNIWIVIWLLFAHWVSDFVLQKHEWSLTKSSSNIALGKHVLTYSIMLVFFLLPVMVLMEPLPDPSVFFRLATLWAAFNGAMHFAVDYVTSRVNKRLYEKGDIHNFFVCVGFDQWLHYFFLFGSYVVLQEALQ